MNSNALIAILACTALLTACESRNVQTDVTGLKDFARRYAAAWSSQDPVAFASFYAQTGSLRVNDGEPAVGRDAITQMAQGFMDAFPDMLVRLDELRLRGDYVKFHWYWTGTNTGPRGTGNAVDLRGFEQWTLDDEGLILESLGHFDNDEYRRQLLGDPEDNVAED